MPSFNLPDLTDSQIGAISHYLKNRFELTEAEWRDLLAAMELLHEATITEGESPTTFAGYFRRYIENLYAERYISACYGFANISVESERLRAAIAKQIVETLREQGLSAPTTPKSQIFLVYVLYWWESFAKGYAFEVEIFRDLAANGIKFAAHSLYSRRERLSPYDLMVAGFQGDIKTSTYFLHLQRGIFTQMDFYITRLYHRPTRRWQLIVLLLDEFWQVLDGKPQHIAVLNEVWDIFPNAARLELQEKKWTVVLYDWWKQRVRVIQTEGTNNE